MMYGELFKQHIKAYLLKAPPTKQLDPALKTVKRRSCLLYKIFVLASKALKTHKK